MSHYNGFLRACLKSIKLIISSLKFWLSIKIVEYWDIQPFLNNATIHKTSEISWESI
jgi:hypothetical protein